MLPTPDPFHVHRCPLDYVCATLFGGSENHLTPADAIRLGERLIAVACEIQCSPETKPKERLHERPVR